MGIRDELLTTIQNFNRSNDGREPARIYLTLEDERRLASMSRDEAGGDIKGDVRDAFQKFGGQQVVWDAEHRHCE